MNLEENNRNKANQGATSGEATVHLVNGGAGVLLGQAKTQAAKPQGNIRRMDMSNLDGVMSFGIPRANKVQNVNQQKKQVQLPQKQRPEAKIKELSVEERKMLEAKTLKNNSILLENIGAIKRNGAMKNAQNARANMRNSKNAEKPEKTPEELGYVDDMARANLAIRRLSEKAKNKKTSGEEIKITYLGGVGEIGKNMTAIEYAGQIVIIDCGVMFPNEEMPGIDLVVPDITYLKENADKVVALLVTHGHEDHIGAIPYLIKNFPKASIYSSRLTLALIENKLREHNVKNVVMHVAKAREPYKVGKFAVEFIDVNHSIADAYAIKISTPAGVIFHTGDFKIDFRPIDGKMIDLPRIAEIGEEGVDLFMCESTNVERSGYTLSESEVGARLEEIFKNSIGRRVFVATFSSNIYRVQQIINLAIKYGRKVATVGRSIENNLDAAARVGKLSYPKEVFIDIEKITNLDDGKVLVICTGAQGEPASALSRLANGEFNKVEIGDNDTVILSSSPIPGNEYMVNRIINNLSKKGAIVVHEDVHASGHACIEELKTMHSLVKAKNFIPVHGEYRHLLRHAELAKSLGMRDENVLMIENGAQVVLRNGQLTRLEDVKAGEVLIDGFGIGDATSVVLRDRAQLAEDGILVATIAIKRSSGEVIGSPVILTRGLVYQDEAEKLNAEIQRILVDAIKNIQALPKFDIEEAKMAIRRPIRNFFVKKIGRSPVVLPVFHLI